jgi:hypothetical protein
MTATLRMRLEAYLMGHGWTKHTDKGPMPMYSKGEEKGLYFAEAVMAQCEEEGRTA